MRDLRLFRPWRNMAAQSSLKFGTSGLRGLVTELCGPPSYGYTAAFLAMLRADGALNDQQRDIYIGRDYRASSPDIAQIVGKAILDSGFRPVDCGALPTPALALAAMTTGAPSIMITGSHIPDDRNGLKFYRASGEIDKADELRISAFYANVKIPADISTAAAFAHPADHPVAFYKRRYTDFFPARCLSGLRVGIYQHSSVARDIIADVLQQLGADVHALGRATAFIPVDTEAVRDEDKALALQWAHAHKLDAIVSTDGDADRPLIADERGHFLRGDLVGAITARLLGVTTLVTPVTSNSQLEKSFRRVTRTKVGSPFVIADVEAQRVAGNSPVIGFEANGGVLLGDDITHDGRTLPRLLTRDAMLPIVAVLASITLLKKPLSDIAAGYHFAYADSTRIEHVPAEVSSPFLQGLRSNSSIFFADAGGAAALNDADGLRFTLANEETVHFRASGNAPELRIYVEAATAEACAARLRWAKDAAQRALYQA